MKRRSPRGLNPEEKDLWERVARTAKPLEGRSPKGTLLAPKPKTAPRKSPEKASISPFAVGSAGQTRLPEHQFAPSVGQRLESAPLQMDQKAFAKMKRGKSRPEGRIDLHGMRLPQARDALTAFIWSSQAKGKRLVLVITGKGRASDDDGPIPVRMGVLRHEVPDWLSRPPLSAAVLQVSQAHQRHGSLEGSAIRQ